MATLVAIGERVAFFYPLLQPPAEVVEFESYSMASSTRKGRNEYKAEISVAAEDKFVKFCKNKEITCQKLDCSSGEKLREEYLKDQDGRCPDFLISKNSVSVFVEIKALTNFTNAKRQKEIDQRIEHLHRLKQSGLLFDEAGNFMDELKGPFARFVKKASSKFKNIKSRCRYPRVLLIDGLLVDWFSINSILLGSHLSYPLGSDGKLADGSFRKTKRAILDETGSNISAIIYWNEDNGRYHGVGNPRAVISLPEKDFLSIFIAP